MRRLAALVEHPVLRWGRRIVRLLLLAVVIALAVVLVTAVSVDLGPEARKWAELYGGRYLDRPLHIGRISFRLYTGRFLFEDLVIEGATPQSRPFLIAKRIEVSIPWSTLFDKRFVLQSIEMTDWKMYVEVLPNGKHSLPRLMPPAGSGKKRPVTVTTEWVRAHRGEFTFEDHATPWSVITRNLDVTVAKPSAEYRGEASFSNGLVSIQDYVPFRADMESSFKIDGSRVLLEKIEMVTDGARSSVHGDINLKYWPEQSFRVESTMDMKRMRELFFPKEHFVLGGMARFEGYFHLFKEPRPDGTTRTGRELFGTFVSPRARIDQYSFDDLRGNVRWSPEALSVTNATAALFGGRAQFGYEMSPLGVRGVRPTARFNARYQGLSLDTLSEFVELDGVRLAGTADGGINLRWPLGRFARREFSGDLHLRPPDGVTLMTKRVPVELIEQGRLPQRAAATLAPIIPLPIGADLTFSSRGNGLVLGPGSRVMTQRTYVEFEGETTMTGEETRLPFFVASADWQESYNVFADMMTALGVRTSSIELGGYGTFEGVLLNDVRRPRIEGTFGVDHIRAFDVDWGAARGRAVIENSYADVSEVTMTSGDSTILADGRFSLGFPRKDGGEEINARVRLNRRPIVDLRHAFNLDDYPVDGLLSGEFHVFGNYRTPLGFGTVQVADGRAYGESFQSATASVGLEGNGVRLTAIDVAKSTGRGSGAAFVGWDATYSFDFAANAIPVEDVALVAKAPLPLSGLVDFTATGSGSFDNPRYHVSGRIRDFFAADEGIGQVVGDLDFTGDTMMVSAKAASPRLAVGVDGTIELKGSMHSDLTFTVTETSLDPYVRAFNPSLSPYTTAVVSGSVRLRGELTRPDALAIDTSIDSLKLRLFDYPLENKEPFRIVLDQNSVSIPSMTLAGADTQLQIGGAVSLGSEMVFMNARGTANLAILQGFVSNVRSSGNAVLEATVTGALRDPDVTGTLRLENGRIRHFGAPQSIDRISGTIAFDTRGVTLDGLRAQVGEGPVQFGGRIDKAGYLPGRLEVTIAGQNMRIRYPREMQSLIDADLTLQGTMEDMRLGGDVVIRDASYTRPFPSNLYDYFLASEAPLPGAPGPTVPLRYDGIRITGASSIHVSNTGDISARLSASPDLELHGTFERPVLSGQIEINPGGELRGFGKRYNVTQGTVYFANPTAIEPSFDLEAETRVRVPGETYLITTSVTGTWTSGRTPFRPHISFDSDPSLSSTEIVALLFSDVVPGQDPELNRLQADAGSRQRQALQEVLARQAVSPISNTVGRAFEEVFGVDTVQITPSLANPNPLSSRLEPCARFQLSKRVFERGNLSYSRSLCSNARDEIILFEFETTDRFSWILSRNEDQTYAIEVRVRHAF